MYILDDVFVSILDRTDLIIGGSKAKNFTKVYFEVRLLVDSPKLAKTNRKQFPTPKKLAWNFCFQPKIKMLGIASLLVIVVVNFLTTYLYQFWIVQTS